VLLENCANRVNRCHAIATSVVFGKDSGTESIRICDLAVIYQHFLGVVELCMQLDQRIPYSRNTDEAHICRNVILPAVDELFKVVAMIAAVPEDLRNLDFVGAADCRLGWYHTRKMLAFDVFPVLRFSWHLSLRENDRLVLRLSVFLLGSGFLNHHGLNIFGSRLCCGRRCLNDRFRLLRFDGRRFCDRLFATATGGEAKR
jgi:hypothetical protein